MSVCPGLTCPFPNPAEHSRGDRWACPRCGTGYRLSRPIKRRWWRNWEAPAGEWRRHFGTWRLDRALSGQGSRWPSPTRAEGPGAAQGAGTGAAPRPGELEEAFAKWALAEGILSGFDEEQAAALVRAFIAGYWHAMAINAAELEIVKKAGYDVFQERDRKIIGGLSEHPQRPRTRGR